MLPDLLGGRHGAMSTLSGQVAIFVSDKSILEIQSCWHTPLIVVLRKQR